MSTTAYWQRVVPDKPEGSCYTLKRLLWQDGNWRIGEETVVVAGSPTAHYIRGYRDALGTDNSARGELTEFLEALGKHHALRVWVDE